MVTEKDRRSDGRQRYPRSTSLKSRRRSEEGRREEGDGSLEEERGGWGERDREEQQRVGSKQEGGATGVGEQASRR